VTDEKRRKMPEYVRANGTFIYIFYYLFITRILTARTLPVTHPLGQTKPYDKPFCANFS